MNTERDSQVTAAQADLAAGTPAPAEGATGGGTGAPTAPTARGRWLREVGWRYLVIAAALGFALFPAVWVLSAAFNPTGSLAGQQLIPDPISTQNFNILLQVPFGRWFLNTMVIAGFTAVGTVLLCAMSAYAYSRMRFVGRRVSLLALLLLQQLPQFLAMIALFLIMVGISRYFPQIGLNTSIGLVMIYLGGALGLNTWLMKGFFDSIPKDMDQAAKVDGASHVQVFFTIVLPLVVPIMAVVTLLTFIMAVNDFILQSIMLRDAQQWTLAVGLFNFIAEDYGARWGPFAAGALIAATPVILLFMFLQRYLTSGLMAGSVKG